MSPAPALKNLNVQEFLDTVNDPAKKIALESQGLELNPKFSMHVPSKDGSPSLSAGYRIIQARATPEERAQAFLKEMKNFKLPPLPKLPAYKKTKEANLLFELAVFDPHWGRLCYGRETGNRNYDLNIAMRDYAGAVDDLLTRLDASRVGRILIVFGNDQFNTDGETGATTAGTRQDSDGRFVKIQKLGYEQCFQTVLKALQIAPVDILVVPGNHDYNISTSLVHLLRARFTEYASHVRILDEDCGDYRWYPYGRNLLCFYHGHNARVNKKLPLFAATTKPQLWGRAKFVEWHLGHLHHEYVKEDQGVITRFLPSICPPDAWHASNGFIGSHQCAKGFIWHPTKGKLEEYNSPVGIEEE